MSMEQRVPEPIAGISSMAMRDVLVELVDAFGRKNGQHVAVESVGGIDVARRIDAGEPFDFVVLASDAIVRLQSTGRIAPGSSIDLARSDIAIAIRSGAPRPDIRTEALIRDAVLSARRIGYSTGPSGAHVVRLFDGWGITDIIASRMVQARPGMAVGTLLARGEVELGFQQLSELINQSGVDVVGVLPPEIQVETVFSAAVCATSTRREATRVLLSFLASPEGDVTKHRHGMRPARAQIPSADVAASSSR